MENKERRFNPEMEKLLAELEESAKELNRLDPNGHFRTWMNETIKRKNKGYVPKYSKKS